MSEHTHKAIVVRQARELGNLELRGCARETTHSTHDTECAKEQRRPHIYIVCLPVWSPSMLLHKKEESASSTQCRGAGVISELRCDTWFHIAASTYSQCTQPRTQKENNNKTTSPQPTQASRVMFGSTHGHCKDTESPRAPGFLTKCRSPSTAHPGAWLDASWAGLNPETSSVWR